MRLSTLFPALGLLGLVTAQAQAQESAPDVPGTPTPAGAAEAPPPYPAAPDSLVVPPGPPAPTEPAPDQTYSALSPPAPEPPPAPATTVYYGGNGQPARYPARYRYVEGTPLPEGYHLESRANRGLVIGGAATFGIPYLIGTFGTLSVMGDGNTGWLAIPVLGPWLTLANRRTSCGEIGEPSPGGFECFSDEAGNGLLIASGVLQALGTAMIAIGLVHTKEYAVADYAKWHVTPVATPKGDYGLVVSGTL